MKNSLSRKELEKLEENPNHNITKYLYPKNKLDNNEIKRCNGAITRRRAKHITEGEKCTVYFLGLEKQTQRQSSGN